jgi:hypothetical protein
MARMVSVAAVVCAVVVIIMQAPWGDGCWGGKKIPAYHAHGLHGFFRRQRLPEALHIMAQFTPKLRLFEQSWRPRLNLAAKVLRGFQDRWLRSDGQFPSREVLAVLLNVFAFDFYKADFFGYDGIPADELWHRSLDEWIGAVDSPQAECCRLCPTRQESECLEAVEALCSGLSHAAEAWDADTFNAMSIDEVVRWMVDELVARGFVAIKYG